MHDTNRPKSFSRLNNSRVPLDLITINLRTLYALISRESIMAVSARSAAANRFAFRHIS